LSKGRGGPFPNLKTVYAHPGFDFTGDRERQVEAAFAVYETEKRLRANGYFDTLSPNYGKDLPPEPNPQPASTDAQASQEPRIRVNRMHGSG
jgi:hypothetical protein